MQNDECGMQNEDRVSPDKISIALCTFNGERFLQAQLQSLVSQARRPDELVEFDDGSTDRSVEMLREFVAPFEVRVHVNEKQLGPAQNFAAAMAACTGSIICFCDQDDVWEPGKIEAMVRAFSATPRPAFVFSDAAMCDDNQADLGYRLWSSVGFSGRFRRQFDGGDPFGVLVRQNVVTGATLAMDARYRGLILPIPGGWMHDGWIAILLSAVAPVAAIDQPLIRYRQHAAQSIGAERRSLYQQYLNAKAMDKNVFADLADQFELVLERLQEQTDYEVRAKVIRRLQEKIAHLRRRSAMRRGEIGRVVPAVEELLSLRYRRYSLGWKSFGQDLFL
jgi:glycosyltransferase involved in cell wall biosynthesis